MENSTVTLVTMDDVKVNELCWAGLKAIKESGLLKSKPDGEDDSRSCSSWPNLEFDADGYVTLIDLGGKRLHRGLPCSPDVFGQFSRLTKLNLAGTDLPLKDIMAILEQVTSRIEALFVGGNGIGAAGAKSLGEWLPKATQLVKLDLRYNDIGAKGMEALCCGLKETKVEYLYIEGNQLGCLGASVLSELLKDENGATSLREIFLGANQVQSKGAADVASSLQINKVVSKIYLEGNNIGKEGAAAFSSILEELDGNTALKNLFVDNNNIGKEGSERLAAALNSSTTIGGSLL